MIMYKSITNFFAIGVIALSLAACSNDEYKGEYSKDGTFEGANQVYFDLNNASDTLYNYFVRNTAYERDNRHGYCKS